MRKLLLINKIILVSISLFLMFSILSCSNNQTTPNSISQSMEKDLTVVNDSVTVDTVNNNSDVKDSIAENNVPNDTIAKDNIANDTIVNEARNSLPKGFVYVKDIIPDVIEDMRYYTTNNFTGSRVNGYYANRAIMTTQAAQALKKAADELRSKGYLIKIFDAYRPQSAVNNFVSWSKSSDQRTKAYYYPEKNKKSLFGPYIARKSGHSRGSTVDMTICDKNSGKEVNMGGHFDYFGTASHPSFTGKYPLGQITAANKNNRLMLRGVMTRHGFKAIDTEWWHFTLRNEPHPGTFYNFPVK